MGHLQICVPHLARHPKAYRKIMIVVRTAFLSFSSNTGDDTTTKKEHTACLA